MIIDLHCDDEALLHIYTSPAGWLEFEQLAHALDPSVVMIADDSGGSSFDEAIATLWTHLKTTFPQIFPTDFR